MHPFSPSHFNQYGKYAKNVFFLCVFFIFSVYSERQMNTASHCFRVSVFVVSDQFVFILGAGIKKKEKAEAGRLRRAATTVPSLPAGPETSRFHASIVACSYFC